MKNILIKAIDFTKKTNLEYWNKTLLQRADKLSSGEQNLNRAGSYYSNLTPEQLEQKIVKIDWRELKNENIGKGFKGLIGNLNGLLGIIALSKLENPLEDLTVDDRKETGFGHLLVQRDEFVDSDITTVILKEEDGNEYSVVTFHPGLPISPSMVLLSDINSKKITVQRAVKLGFTYAKMTIK